MRAITWCLLQAADSTVYLDLGAGKGYLSSMLCSGFCPQHVVMLDSGSFRLKADRCFQLFAALPL